MGVISQNGIDYPVPSVPVQSDGSATDLTNAAVPTGQTIKSYLNSNLVNFMPKSVDGVGNIKIIGTLGYFPSFTNGSVTLNVASVFPNVSDVSKIKYIMGTAMGGILITGLTSNKSQIVCSLYGSTYTGNTIACDFLLIMTE